MSLKDRKKTRLLEDIQKSVGREYDKFKRYTLRHNKKYIFDSCCKVQFYGCVSEYFKYNEDISDEVLQLFSNNRSILAELWDIYLEFDQFEANTWEEIDELIKVFMKENQ